ncbi:MAG: DUF2493 domain-containing protein [Chloroflexota bacterium]|nr:DUF2493 domain-containing protein [Chloroflexota bacterium]
MRTIIAGSRDYRDPALVAAALAVVPFAITHVISGGALGVDRAGEAWATAHDLPLTVMPAAWTQFGKSAGYRRNEAMAAVAEALVAIWDGHSPGTAHMLDIATRRGLTVFVFCPAAHPELLALAQIAAGRAAMAHYNALHLAVWRAKEAWERALMDPDPQEPVTSTSLARAQMALDRYRPQLLQLYAQAAGAAALPGELGQPWPAAAPAGALDPTPATAAQLPVAA